MQLGHTRKEESGKSRTEEMSVIYGVIFVLLQSKMPGLNGKIYIDFFLVCFSVGHSRWDLTSSRCL